MLDFKCLESASNNFSLNNTSEHPSCNCDGLNDTSALTASRFSTNALIKSFHIIANNSKLYIRIPAPLGGQVSLPFFHHHLMSITIRSFICLSILVFYDMFPNGINLHRRNRTNQTINPESFHLPFCSFRYKGSSVYGSLD